MKVRSRGVIDWAHVQDLKTEMGDSFDEIVDVFLQEVGEGMAQLGPVDGLAMDLHALRGAALNLGFADFARLCGEGEDRATRGEGAHVDLNAVRACFAASQAEFQAFLRRSAA